MDSDRFGQIMLLCVLLGLFILLLVVEFMPLAIVENGVLPVGADNGIVSLKGTVVSVRDLNSSLRLVVGQYCEAGVVVFNDGTFLPRKGQNISVIGRVQEFKGKKELVADQAKIII